jgi:hypothetical protein
MPLLLECACSKKLKVRDELAGKKVKWPSCGNVLVAPAPAAAEPPELVEMIEEDKPPMPSAKSKAASSSDEEDRPVAAWESKKKTTPTSNSDEPMEDEEEDKPAPFWLFPGRFSTEVMALAGEGIYFGSLKGDALKRAQKLLRNGSHAAESLGEKAIYIPWNWITSIESNQRLRPFTIHYNNGQDILSKVLTPSDGEARDAIFEAINEFLSPTWVMTNRQLTPVTATLLPIICIVVELIVTIGLAIGSHYLADEGEWTGRGRGAAIAALLNLLRWMGPIWTGVVGLFVAILIAIWMMVRIIAPPIEMSLHPKPVEEQVSDEE